MTIVEIRGVFSNLIVPSGYQFPRTNCDTLVPVDFSFPNTFKFTHEPSGKFLSGGGTEPETAEISELLVSIKGLRRFGNCLSSYGDGDIQYRDKITVKITRCALEAFAKKFGIDRSDSGIFQDFTDEVTRRLSSVKVLSESGDRQFAYDEFKVKVSLDSKANQSAQ
jgi:hypothetical protein